VYTVVLLITLCCME